MAESKWISHTSDKYGLRDTLFNRSVAIMPQSLDEMATGFDELFSNITSYLDEIASVKLYPFPVVDNSVSVGQLTTTHGTDAGVWVANLGTNTRIFNLGYIYMDMSTFDRYAPYSKYILWLPWFSFVDIDPTKVANRYLLIRLSVDYQTGQGQYILSTSVNRPSSNTWYYMKDTDSSAEKVIATYTFNLGIDIPLGESNASDLTRNAVMGAVKSAVGFAAGMALGSAPIATATVSTTIEDTSKGYSRGDYKGARMLQRSENVDTHSEHTTTEHYTNPTKEYSGSVQAGLSALAYNNASGSGDRSNQPMLLWDMPEYPRMLVYRSRISPLTDSFNKLNGSPLGSDCKLSSVGGFTKVSNVHVDGINATDTELKMIQSMLYQGVVLPKATTTIVTIGEETYTVGTSWTLNTLYKTKPLTTKWFIDEYNRIWDITTGHPLMCDGEYATLSDTIDTSAEYEWDTGVTTTIL